MGEVSAPATTTLCPGEIAAALGMQAMAAIAMVRRAWKELCSLHLAV
jgi:hypothetical protein